MGLSWKVQRRRLVEVTCQPFPDGSSRDDFNPYPSSQRLECPSCRLHSLHSMGWASLDNRTSTIQLRQFNPDLTLLKPSCNGEPLTYSHWGGTIHRRVEGPAPETGLGFFDSLEAIHLRKPLALTLDLTCRAARQSSSRSDKALRPDTTRERLFRGMCYRRSVIGRRERVRPRLRRRGCAAGAVQRGIRPAAGKCRGAEVQAADLPFLRARLRLRLVCPVRTG
jgi:hypothetical protein